MPNIIKARFKLRSGTTADWLAHDEVLANAEVGEEVTTSGERLRKIGNGIDKFSDLPYRVNAPVDRSAAPTDGQTLVFNESTGLLEWKDAGKTYQAGTNITIDNPTSATPTINSNAGLQIDDRVATYANLPSPPTEGTGATYLVDADGLLYVWDGSSWPDEGAGIHVQGGLRGSSAALKAAILASGPLAYFPLDEQSISGTTVADASGNNHPATFDSAPTAFGALIPGDDTPFAYHDSKMSIGDAMGLTPPLDSSLSICTVLRSVSTDFGWGGLRSMGLFDAFAGVGDSEAVNCQFRWPNIGSDLLIWEYGAGVNFEPQLPDGIVVNVNCILHIVKDSAMKTLTLYRNGTPAFPALSYAHEPTGGTASNLPYVDASTAYLGHWAFFDKALTADDVRAHAKAAGFA